MKWEKDLCGSSFCSHVVELLDQNWFFQNIFSSARMVRSLAAASCSSPITEMVDRPVEEIFSTDHFAKDDSPLLPRIEWENHHEEGRIVDRSSTLNSRPPGHSLHAPSPHCENLQHSLMGGAAQVRIIPKPRAQPPRSSALPNKAEAMGNKIKNHSSTSIRRVHKYRSSKSLSDLEFEEVQGFMDLGFIFKKENLNSHVVKVVPGLQRLGEKDDKKVIGNINGSKVNRPYLSEAWLVHRLDSPILNWNMSSPRRQSGVDMKKHLKFWARAVASTVHHEY